MGSVISHLDYHFRGYQYPNVLRLEVQYIWELDHRGHLDFLPTRKSLIWSWLDVLPQPFLGNLENSRNATFLESRILPNHLGNAFCSQKYVRHPTAIVPSKNKVILFARNFPAKWIAISCVADDFGPEISLCNRLDGEQANLLPDHK